MQLHSDLERHRNKIGCARNLSARTAPLKLGEPREMWKRGKRGAGGGEVVHIVHIVHILDKTDGDSSMLYLDQEMKGTLVVDPPIYVCVCMRGTVAPRFEINGGDSDRAVTRKIFMFGRVQNSEST